MENKTGPVEIAPIGIPWYHEADYNGLREMFEDGQKLPLAYSEWFQPANSLFEFLKSAGVAVYKVYITPEEFPDWCVAHKHRLDRHARKVFVGEFVTKSYSD